MIITSNYTIYKKGGIHYIFNKDNPICPLCNGTVRARDSRQRLVKDSVGSFIYLSFKAV